MRKESYSVSTVSTINNGLATGEHSGRYYEVLGVAKSIVFNNNITIGPVVLVVLNTEPITIDDVIRQVKVLYIWILHSNTQTSTSHIITSYTRIQTTNSSSLLTSNIHSSNLTVSQRVISNNTLEITTQEYADIISIHNVVGNSGEGISFLIGIMVHQ